MGSRLINHNLAIYEMACHNLYIRFAFFVSTSLNSWSLRIRPHQLRERDHQLLVGGGHLGNLIKEVLRVGLRFLAQLDRAANHLREMFAHRCSASAAKLSRVSAIQLRIVTTM